MNPQIRIVWQGETLLSAGGSGSIALPTEPERRHICRLALSTAMTLLDSTDEKTTVAWLSHDGKSHVDTGTREVVLDGAALRLSATEFNIIAFLASRPGHWRSRRQIMDACGISLDTDERTVDSHIKRARRHGAARIETQYDVGYRWRP